MDNFIATALFLTNGAAWGLVWAGFCGVIKSEFSSPSLLRLVGFIFAVLGSIVAIFLCWELYSEYSVASESEKSAIKDSYLGRNFVSNGGRFIIQLSPLLLLFKGLRKSKLIAGLIGLCYILLPYYGQIVSNF